MSALIIAQQAKNFWPSIVSEPQLIMHRENAVFRVETTNGSAALRIHRSGYRQKNEIVSELAWMAHLAISGLELPAPIANCDGLLISEIEDENRTFRVVDLLTWVKGIPLGRSNVPLAFGEHELRNIFQDVGRNLARLHALSDTWNRPASFQRHQLNKDGFLGDKPAWGRFWEASILSTTEKTLMLSVRQRAGETLEMLLKSGADYGLIHADLVRENIFVHEGKTCFIDFDDAGFGFRMFDLAVALVKNRQEPHYETIKVALLEGYKSQRAITSTDENSLGLFLALRDFAYLGWADARRAEPSMAPRIEKIKQDTLIAAEQFLANE